MSSGGDAQPNNRGGRGRKTDFSSESGLPDADPGDLLAHRWRPALVPQARRQEPRADRGGRVGQDRPGRRDAIRIARSARQLGSSDVRTHAALIKISSRRSRPSSRQRIGAETSIKTIAAVHSQCR
jgi:hypothetical protein